MSAKKRMVKAPAAAAAVDGDAFDDGQAAPAQVVDGLDIGAVAAQVAALQVRAATPVKAPRIADVSSPKMVERAIEARRRRKLPDTEYVKVITKVTQDLATIGQFIQASRSNTIDRPHCNQILANTKALLKDYAATFEDVSDDDE